MRWSRATTAAGWLRRPEAGTVFGIQILEWIARLGGRRVLHLALWPVALYFIALRHAERRASRRFLSRVLQRPASFGEVFRHFLTFSRMSADRMCFLTGTRGSIPVRFHDLEPLRRLVDRGRGGVFLGSHMGSFEAARTVVARHPDIGMRMILDRAVNRRLMQRLEAASPEFAESIIDAGGSAADFALRVGEALRQGEWIGFLADRYRPGDRVTTCEFLGEPARFPLGPFLVAATFELPVVCLFPLYVRGCYEVHFEILTESLSVPREQRHEQLQSLVQAYADRLTFYARREPYNWFNFYDFWA